MRRKPLLFVAIALLLALGIWVANRTEQPTINSPRDSVSTAGSGSIAPAGNPTPFDPNAPLTPPPAGMIPPVSTSPSQESRSSSPSNITPTANVPPPDSEALIEVDKVSLMIRDYRTVAGENPVGTNAEIMAAVMGGNPKGATFGPPEGVALNQKGELIDRWGSPYFFHQLSRDRMEIRSAGVDKVLWTADDPVVR